MDQTIETNKFYGIYRGLVVDNLDPKLAGRIKVKVYPYFAEIASENLPWAKPAMPLTAGAGDGTGSFCVPNINSFVFVFFEDGDPYQPVYFAEAPTATKGIPASSAINYPKRRVIKMASGIEIILDDSTGEIIITGSGDVIVQGANVRINPI